MTKDLSDHLKTEINKLITIINCNNDCNIPKIIGNDKPAWFYKWQPKNSLNKN